MDIDSATSTEDINIGDVSKHKVTTDTDFYMNLLANPEKIKPEAQPSLAPVMEESTSKMDSERSPDLSDSRKSSKHSVKSDKSEDTRRSRHSVRSETEHRNYNRYDSEDVKINRSELSEKEKKIKKIDLLRKLSELKAKGYELSKEYNFSSSIEEMEYEFELLKSYVDKNNGVKMYKNMLVNGVALLEFFNDKYDPFDFHLQGWSEHMSVEVDSYEEVLEEIYEKYKGSGRKMPPELKLLFLVTASGAAFHFSKSTLGKAGLGKPGMVSSFLNKPKEESRFMTEQEIHIQNLKKQRREENNKMNGMPPRAPPMRSGMPGMFSAGVTPTPGAPVNIPNNVVQILQKIKTEQNQNRVVSETTVDSEFTTERKRGRKPKSVIHINT